MRQAATSAVRSHSRTRKERNLNPTHTHPNFSSNKPISPNHTLYCKCTQNSNYNISAPYPIDNNIGLQTYNKLNNIQDKKRQRNRNSTKKKNTSFRHRIKIQKNTGQKRRKFKNSLHRFTNNTLDQKSTSQIYHQLNCHKSTIKY